VRIIVGVLAIAIFPLMTIHVPAQEHQAKQDEKASRGKLSFQKDIFPIFKKNCLPCHAEDNFNPSELSMDDYELIKSGGKNGPVWIAGNSKESLIIKKLSTDPPFGDRMPFNSKRKVAEGKAKWLTDDEIETIRKWIDEGAKNN
jgi:Planctomycete cytochrome C